MYEDARTAVEMKAPAMKLTMAIEAAPDPDFVRRLIPLLTEKPLAAILRRAVCGRVPAAAPCSP